MVESFAQHTGLHNDVKLVVVKLLEYAAVGRPLAGMDVRRAHGAFAKGLRYLDAMVTVQGGGNDLQAMFSGHVPQRSELVDGLVDDGGERFVRHYDATPNPENS